MTARRNPVLVLIALLVHFGSAAANDDARDKLDATNIGLLVEWIELDHATANQLAHKFANEPNATKLREVLEEKLDTGEAKLIESNYIATNASGDEVYGKVDSIWEQYYPTESTPPDPPNPIEKKPAKPIEYDVSPEELGVPQDTIEFYVRNTGTHVGFEPRTVASGSIELLFYWEMVQRVPDRLHGDPRFSLSGASQPSFQVTNNATILVVPDGEDKLVGLTRSPNDEGKSIAIILRATILN